MTNYERDFEQEQYPIAYLRKYFFPYIQKKGIMQQYITDKNTQLSGVDIVLEYPNKQLNLDIKAQMNKYINNPTPTFCLELEYMKDKELKEGWLFREDLLTDMYGLIWIHDAKCDGNYLLHSEEDINELTLLFAHKRVVHKYLENIGIGRKAVGLAIQMLKKQPEEKRCKQLRITPDLKLFQTLYLPEQPVNLVVPNKIWDKLACSKYVVRKDEIKIEKEGSKYCEKTEKI